MFKQTLNMYIKWNERIIIKNDEYDIQYCTPMKDSMENMNERKEYVQRVEDNEKTCTNNETNLKISYIYLTRSITWCR